MKLHSAKIQNFRVHAGEELVTIAFDDQLHVIHGPNESGKSTLMDAVAACLFEKCNLTGKAYDAMQPDDGSKPHIEVEFENAGLTYLVSKHFKGQAGTCELQISRDGHVESTHKGSEAEQLLNEALRLPSAGRGDRKHDQMAHWRLLWINQSRSTDLPTDDINPETRDDLQGLLTSETGGALTTPQEATWIEELDKQVAERFTSTGKPKAGSKAVTLSDEVESIVSELNEAEKLASSVEHDSDRYITNGTKLAEIEEQLPNQKRQLKAREKEKDAIDVLQQQQKENDSAIQIKQRDCDAATGHVEELRNLERAVESRNKEIDRTAKVVASIDEQLTKDQVKRGVLEKKRDEHNSQFTHARRRTLRSQAHLKALRATAELDQQEQTLDKATKHEAEITKIAEQIAVLPVIEDDVDALQELSSSLRQIEAALEAASAKIRIQSKHQVTLVHGNETEQIKGGGAREERIEQQAEITIGSNEATIQITPGGEDLEERRERVTTAKNQLSERLVELGVQSLDDAKRKLRERQSLENQLQVARTRLSDIAADGIGVLQTSVDTAKQALQSAHAELERHSQTDDPLLPGEVSDAEEQFHEQQEIEAAAEEERDASREGLQSLDDQIATAKADRRLEVQKHDSLTSQNDIDGNKIEALCESYGDKESLNGQIDKLVGELKALNQQSTEIGRQLEELQPSVIAAEIERLERAITTTQQEHRSIEAEQNRLIGQLSNNDAVGLNERIGDLCASLESKKEELAREQKQSNAMRLLLDTVHACREEMTRQIMEPLRKKVEPLLRVMFGGAQLNFTIDDDTKQLSLKPLTRDRVQDTFDRLSVGTKEQVGVAVRLALAQVLAEQYGGKLPVILDEPFVNTDPERQSRALAMLNMVKRDLQLVVLTCDFSEYRDLGVEPQQITELKSI